MEGSRLLTQQCPLESAETTSDDKGSGKGRRSSSVVPSPDAHASYTDGKLAYYENQQPASKISLGLSICTFRYKELVIATDDFSDANALGQGGFGYVHKGVLPYGKEVAIKQLRSDSWQGEQEFVAEIEIISRVHHKNLVSLVGYCISEEKRLLVYELVPNKTLEFHLHGQKQHKLDWGSRLRIAVGSAQGLAYLHEECYPKIIHRDIKASNILLDYRFQPKVSDFGLAKVSHDYNTHLTTRVIGSFGYLAPEYAATGKLTEKSDVYSFGVMLLELITGRSPAGEPNSAMVDGLVDWAKPLISKSIELGAYDRLVDPSIQNYDTDKMMRMIVCAAACIHHSARYRPQMSQIVRVLKGDVSLDDLNHGLKLGNSSLYASPYENIDTGLLQYTSYGNYANGRKTESSAESSLWSTNEISPAFIGSPR